MTHIIPDTCPNCGELGPLGLRCHPKWSLKVGILLRKEDGGEPAMVAYYAHDKPSAMVLLNAFAKGGSNIILAFEHWNGERWIEVTP